MVRKLSILVPIYNEAATVEILLRRVLDVQLPIAREIVAVDDGSTDGSFEILNRLARDGLIKLIRHEKNRGKGAAVATAMRHAEGDVLVIQDADLELNPQELPMLLAPILSGRAEVCYGSRFLAHVPWSKRCRPAYWANLVLNKVSNLLNGIHITDFNTCYKMMTDKVVRRLSITRTGFAMESEITTKIARMGYEIIELPVRYQPRTVAAGKKIRLRDAVSCLAAMVYFRFFWTGDEAAVANETTTTPVSKPTAEMGMSQQHAYTSLETTART